MTETDLVSSPRKIEPVIVEAMHLEAAKPVRSGRRPTALSALTVAYLVAPVGLFLVTWFKPFVGVPIVLALAMGVSAAFRGVGRPRVSRPTTLQIAGFIVIALWVAMSGVVDIVQANADWQKHDALFHDLTAQPWPVTYFHEGHGDVFMRYYVAWYLVPAALAKVFGAAATMWFAYGWTLIGMLLFSANVTSFVKLPVAKAVAVVTVMVFSGLDVIGALITHRPGHIGIGTHIEHWAVYFSYDSTTTQLFWAPQHALPGWLFAVLAFRFWKQEWFVRSVGTMFAAMLLWSPITAVGALPVIALVLFQHLRRGHRNWVFNAGNLVSAPIVAVVLSLYLLQHLGGNPAGVSWMGRPFSHVAVNYLLFTTLEVAVIVAVIACLGLFREKKLIAVSVLTLYAIPLFRVGVFNDLAMRGSIVALTVLLCACVAAFEANDHRQSERQSRGRKRFLLPLAVVVLASVTSAEELSRIFTEERVARGDYSILQQLGATGAYIPDSQYLASRDSAMLSAVMKRQDPTLAFGETIDFTDVEWTLQCACAPGEVTSTTHPASIASDRLVDAFMEADVEVPAGLYRVEADISYDLGEAPRPLNVNSSNKTDIGHVSLVGAHKVITLDSGNERARIEKFLYVPESMAPARLGFGLGGWNLGQGKMTINHLSLQRITRS